MSQNSYEYQNKLNLIRQQNINFAAIDLKKTQILNFCQMRNVPKHTLYFHTVTSLPKNMLCAYYSFWFTAMQFYNPRSSILQKTANDYLHRKINLALVLGLRLIIQMCFNSLKFLRPQKIQKTAHQKPVFANRHQTWHVRIELNPKTEISDRLVMRTIATQDDIRLVKVVGFCKNRYGKTSVLQKKSSFNVTNVK